MHGLLVSCLLRLPGAQVVQGEGPGARYAHVLALVGQRFLLVLGGNDGYKVRRRSRLPRLLRATTLCALTRQRRSAG